MNKWYEITILDKMLHLHFNPHSAGIVWRRQILTTKVYDHTGGVKLFTLIVDP